VRANYRECLPVAASMPGLLAPRHRLGRKLGLHRLKQRGIDNGLVLAAVNLASVDDLADVEVVLSR
jgi:hypothetical protein